MAKNELYDMTKCPDCGTIQNPPRDIENPDLQYCSNPNCECEVHWNSRTKKAVWSNINWDF